MLFLRKNLQHPAAPSSPTVADCNKYDFPQKNTFKSIGYSQKCTIFAVFIDYQCKRILKHMENPEQTPKNAPDTSKPDGRFANVSLTPGSETHRRFVRLMTETGTNSPKGMVDILMDAYENPPKDADSAATIANLEKQLSDATNGVKTMEETIADLKLQLEAARNDANENATKVQQIQTSTEGCIIIKPNPVVAYFLNEMAQHEKTTPAKILERLFVDDLQNPRANNLPYTVESSRIREVMNELKQQQ